MKMAKARLIELAAAHAIVGTVHGSGFDRVADAGGRSEEKNRFDRRATVHIGYSSVDVGELVVSD